jgi:outer membrane protein OmpA-like peptidoglycan-associated protein
MKKTSLKGLMLFLFAGSFLTSCDLLKDVKYTVTPNPLEMHGDSVKVTVDVTFPEKGINKKAKVEVTPMLGNTALKTVTITGEKVESNGTKIAYKAGGSYKYTDVVAYKTEFENADLKVTGKVYKGDKEKEGQFEEIKIADATIVTPLWVNKDFKVIYHKDAFKRVNEMTTSAMINFDKGKSELRANEMKDKDMVDYKNWLIAAQTNAKIAIKNIELAGWASPEGEDAYNVGLSNDRSATTEKLLVDLAKSLNLGKITPNVYKKSGNGPDTKGLKEYLKTSTIPAADQDVIIRMMAIAGKSDTTGKTARKTLMELGKVYQDLEKLCFPMLRRVEIKTIYDLTGYTDEELKTVSQSTPDSLDVEELLFTATLTNDVNEKLRLYNIGIKNFPKDYRVHNNAGAALYTQNKMAEAKAAFEKSNSLKENTIAKNNLAAIAGATDDRKKCRELLTQAKGAGDGTEVSYNNGILDIQDGKYSSAITNFGKTSSFNLALAQLLNGKPADCIATIDSSTDKESAQGYYLKAVASARLDKVDAVASNLKNAIAKDSSLKAKAANDREFLKYSDNATFTSVVK